MQSEPDNTNHNDSKDDTFITFFLTTHEHQRRTRDFNEVYDNIFNKVF